jgi:hypothetical protein
MRYIHRYQKKLFVHYEVKIDLKSNEEIMFYVQKKIILWYEENQPLSEKAVLKELHTIINKSPKVNSSKAEKMMKLKEEVEANIKEWGWVK